jgi:hypothetical protein
MRTVLGTQSLVQRVELFVAPPRTKRGYAYHLRKILIPQETSSLTDARNAAATLATQGYPIPPNASASNGWVASFLVSSRLSHLLANAKSGEYVGPIRKPTGYLVVQFLGRGVHLYGRSTRQQLTTKYFHSWLKKTVQATRPKCLNKQQQSIQCPPVL